MLNGVQMWIEYIQKWWWLQTSQPIKQRRIKPIDIKRWFKKNGKYTVIMGIHTVK